MMNRLMALVTAAVTLILLTACGGSSQSTPATSPTGSETTSIQDTTPSIHETAPVFPETVIVDDDNCTVQVLSIDRDSLFGYTLKVYLENKTDKELMFSLDAVSVNGFMCDPFWSATVTPGMKANEEISFLPDSFADNGITDVTDITFTLNVYDYNDWAADYLVSQVHTLYPLGEDAVQAFERNSVEGEIVLFDNENCTMIVTGYDPDNIWGYTVNVYLENKTNDSLIFTVDNASVNGFMCDPFWAESVAPGKRSNTQISWMSSAFAENGITGVESITLPIRVYDENDWTRDDFHNETYTLTP